jgi:glycerol kinase
MNTGKVPVSSKNRLLTTVAWDVGQGPVYALEGSVFTGGAVIQWLRDELELVRTSAESEEIALSVSDSGGVFLVPAFSGLGAPWWDMYARGTIVGITRGTKKAHIVRAALEAIAYQSADLLKSMEADSDITLATLKVDGGASANNFLMQFQADLTQRSVIRPACVETTAVGAALLAGLASGHFTSLEQITKLYKAGKEFKPSGESARTKESFRLWHKAVERARSWIDY